MGPFACIQPAGSSATMESAPMVANGVVYVGENNDRIYAFAARGCGSQLCDKVWEFITQDPLVNSSPAMVNGTLYVSGTNFGAVPELYVFELVGQLGPERASASTKLQASWGADSDDASGPTRTQ